MADPNFNEMMSITKKVDPRRTQVVSKQTKFAEFPVEEYRSRYAKAIALMEHEGLDALLVTQEENVRYFTGYLSILWCSLFRPYVALLPRDPSVGPSLIVPAQETGNALHTSWVNDVHLYPDQENPVPHILAEIKKKGLETGMIGTELGFGMRLGMNVNQFEELRSSLASGRIVDGTPIIQGVRMIKSAAEIECLRRACEISQTATQAGWEALRPGMTEKELAAIMASTMYREGAEMGTKASFFAMMAGPDRYKTVNALASDKVIEEGDFVIVDGGAVYKGYATDFIRQAVLGSPTQEQQRFFDIAREANDAAIQVIGPGVSGADVYEAGMKVFERHDVLEYNVLNIIGHGVGMDLHEVPWLGERDKVYSASTILEPGMVVCIEPVFAGANDPEWQKGIWIQEDKVVVTATGHEVITNQLSKELWVQQPKVHATA
ncbi:MAG: Xaa-Pro peptidase family protein [Chloroflexota bacterium]|nr:Xaa-Pro peptidase family protein [Chloroflexota bacterium]